MSAIGSPRTVFTRLARSEVYEAGRRTMAGSCCAWVSGGDRRHAQPRGDTMLQCHK